ncbi:MAG TPA: hypothetical protein PLZ21_02300 [Armatimonadota bacterium]|nr:hypothetical protein [Armatimonadota bacterium]HOP79373.1 hypothetical protein [Armatimonadota bacterium]
MFESTHQNKICPLLATAVSKDQVSSGSSWASRCKGDDCAWWDTEQNNCAIAVLSKELGEALTSVSLAKQV